MALTVELKAAGGDPASPVLFVGEVNPYGTLPGFALHYLPRTASGNRLRKILGLRDTTYAKLAKINLCSGRYSVFSARTRATEILTMACDPTGRVADPPKILVLLGARVRDAFGTLDRPFFTISQISSAGQVAGRILIFLPHPSGRCRSWSDENNVAKARALLREHMPTIPWGEI